MCNFKQYHPYFFFSFPSFTLTKSSREISMKYLSYLSLSLFFLNKLLNIRKRRYKKYCWLTKQTETFYLQKFLYSLYVHISTVVRQIHLHRDFTRDCQAINDSNAESSRFYSSAQHRMLHCEVSLFLFLFLSLSLTPAGSCVAAVLHSFQSNRRGVP